MHDSARLAPAIVGIIPAAGRSLRMGTDKPLLQIDGRPMVVGIVEALLEGGVMHLTIVASPTLRQKLPPLPARVDFSLNPDPNSQMIDSIRIGLSSAPDAVGYLICPADAARITAADVRRCVEAFTAAPDRIIIATHANRRGHPMIFPASLASVVQSPECDGGLNQLARNRTQLTREVACDSPGTTSNVNTPADYVKLT